MSIVRALLAAALLWSAPAQASAPPFHTEPTGGHAVIVEAAQRQDGEFFGYVVQIERVGASSREPQRYHLRCEADGRSPGAVWLIRGSTRDLTAIDPTRAPAAGERLAYNLWWAVCRRLMQRY